MEKENLSAIVRKLAEYARIEAEIQALYQDQFSLLDLAREYIRHITELNGGEPPKRIICLSDKDADLWEKWKDTIREWDNVKDCIAFFHKNKTQPEEDR